MSAEDGGETFLGRWSRRKVEQREEEKAPPAAPESAAPPAPLPPVESLTPESDYGAFMNPKVEDALRRVALKKLFSDPHFNIPDPFEPYSADLTGGEAIPEAMLASLEQFKTMLRKPPEELPAAAPETGEKPQPDEPGKQDA